MHTIDVRAELDYSVDTESTFYFSIVAAQTSHQTVREESLVIEPERSHETLPFSPSGHRLIRLEVPPGPLKLRYQALVDVDPRFDDPATLEQVPYGDLPSEVLRYLNPSRYCESDKLGGFVSRCFGDSPSGYGRVKAVSDWVGRNLSYAAGSTDASSSAADVLLQRVGVCRDFAHVGISMCRALGIPARYVTGYGIGVEPQDFHGFFEAYLDGHWYLFDPTGMAPATGLVRIGVGRDAADAPFANFVGTAQLIDKRISVKRAGGPAVPPAVATATA